MLELDQYPLPAPGVVSRIVNDEAVLVLPEKGEVKVINEVGARIWELADGTKSARQIAREIFDEYEVDQETAEKDTLEFLNDLENRGAIMVLDHPVE